MQAENKEAVAEPQEDIADDLLKGVSAIAAFLGPAFTERSVYHLADKAAIPVIKLPGTNTIYSRKSALRRAFQLEA